MEDQAVGGLEKEHHALPDGTRAAEEERGTQALAVGPTWLLVVQTHRHLLRLET